MALKIIEHDNRFRIESQHFLSDWVADTPENRKAMIVFLRLLVNDNGKALFTHQELAEIVESSNRQASSHHFESFVSSGRDLLLFLSRKRKVNSEVVDAVLEELLLDPLAKISELSDRVNNRLSRNDISHENIKAALKSISFFKVQGEIKKRLSKGSAHYKEEYLLSEMMSSFSPELAQKAGISVFRPNSDSFFAYCWHSAFFDWKSTKMGVFHYDIILSPLSVLGRWFSVHKTTILRWVISLALSLWPIVYSWINKRVKAKIVYLDEKWLKIKGKWHYWFVVLDKETGLPVISSLLASKSKWSLRWIGYKLKQLKKLPQVLITDGMLGYDCIANIDQRIHHLLCHFRDFSESLNVVKS